MKDSTREAHRRPQTGPRRQSQSEQTGIPFHRIRIATPRHNGRVERQHRTDEKRFYRIDGVKVRSYLLRKSPSFP